VRREHLEGGGSPVSVVGLGEFDEEHLKGVARLVFQDSSELAIFVLDDFSAGCRQSRAMNTVETEQERAGEPGLGVLEFQPEISMALAFMRPEWPSAAPT
jgi:hypothetical protein